MATYNEPLMAYSSPHYAYDGTLVSEQTGTAVFTADATSTAAVDDAGEPSAEMVIS